jgi:hypothetical protein
MKPIALIFVIGLLAAVGFACAPPPPSPAYQVPPTSQVCQNGALNNVPFLAEPFQVGMGMDYGQIPQADPAPVNPEIQSDLTAAFNSAPQSFKDQLCGLTGIFINRYGCTGYEPDSCALSDYQVADNSWGLRRPTGERYIAISLGLWKNNPCQSPRKICPPTFQTFETREIQALLNHTAQTDRTSPPHAPQLPRTLSSPVVSPNTSTMSVLAALAHEFGHVHWWDAFVQPPGSPHATNTATFCGGGFYPSGYWEGSMVDIPPGRWIEFGEILDQPKGSAVSQLSNLLASRSYTRVGDALNGIYTSGRWASALAAYSPDEDYVETFELFVLLNANPGLQTLTFSTGGRSADILRNVNDTSELGRKLKCFGSLPQLYRSR